MPVEIGPLLLGIPSPVASLVDEAGSLRLQSWVVHRAGYDDFNVENPDTPLCQFIMPLVLNDFVYCLGWYIVETFENDYPELQDEDTLEGALIWLKNKLEAPEEV